MSTNQRPLIAIDWGTTSLRGARLGAACLHDLPLDQVADHGRHQRDRLDVLEPRERERRLRKQEVAGKDRELRIWHCSSP